MVIAEVYNFYSLSNELLAIWSISHSTFFKKDCKVHCIPFISFFYPNNCFLNHIPEVPEARLEISLCLNSCRIQSASVTGISGLELLCWSSHPHGELLPTRICTLSYPMGSIYVESDKMGHYFLSPKREHILRHSWRPGSSRKACIAANGYKIYTYVLYTKSWNAPLFSALQKGALSLYTRKTEMFVYACASLSLLLEKSCRQALLDQRLLNLAMCVRDTNRMTTKKNLYK